MKRNRKAKILATLGPASSSEEIIDKLFVAGCDVFRLNFSHGSIEDHRNNYQYIRSLEKKYDHATCILADLQGPKLRIGTFIQDKIELKKGQSFILDLDSSPGNKDRVNALQIDIKIKGSNVEITEEALEKAKVARLNIFDHMSKTISGSSRCGVPSAGLAFTLSVIFWPSLASKNQ